MGAKLGGGGGPNADMNLTPLIDIVLVVLIIMMVNIPIQIEEMTVKLPSNKPPPTPPPDTPSEQLVIAVYDNGEVALNRQLMKEDRLIYEVTRRLRPMADKNVFVDAGPTVPYGAVVDVVDLAREAGAEKVGLARLKDGGPLEATSVAPGAAPRGVTVSQPKIVGAMSDVKADAAIQRIVPSIRGCYDQRLAVRGDLSGRLTLRYGVGPQGEHLEPAKVMPGGTVDDPELVACIQTFIDQVTFEPLGEGLTAAVQYTFLFSPG